MKVIVNKIINKHFIFKQLNFKYITEQLAFFYKARAKIKISALHLKQELQKHSTRSLM